jgi:hypothetical protein
MVKGFNKSILYNCTKTKVSFGEIVEFSVVDHQPGNRCQAWQFIALHFDIEIPPTKFPAKHNSYAFGLIMLVVINFDS